MYCGSAVGEDTYGSLSRRFRRGLCLFALLHHAIQALEDECGQIQGALQNNMRVNLNRTQPTHAQGKPPTRCGVRVSASAFGRDRLHLHCHTKVYSEACPPSTPTNFAPHLPQTIAYTCVCKYARVCTSTCACRHASMHARTHAYAGKLLACMSACVRACGRARLLACTQVSLRLRTCVYVSCLPACLPAWSVLVCKCVPTCM